MVLVARFKGWKEAENNMIKGLQEIKKLSMLARSSFLSQDARHGVLIEHSTARLHTVIDM